MQGKIPVPSHVDSLEKVITCGCTIVRLVKISMIMKSIEEK